VHAHADAGYDFIKVYNLREEIEAAGRLTRVVPPGIAARISSEVIVHERRW